MLVEMLRIAPLRVPLAVKIAGANLVVVVILVGAWLLTGGHVSIGAAVLVAMVLGMHAGLMFAALRPIKDLEDVALRAWQGDYGARVRRSSVADPNVERLGSMVNMMLQNLEAERNRLRELATGVIAAGDRDRAAIARELHDSTAQRAAALLFELGSAARDATDPELAARLHNARDAAEAILEEVRGLSLTVHTRVLDDLGLEAALNRLARETSRETEIDVSVDVAGTVGRLAPNIEAALYSVAREAVRNAVRHASPASVQIMLFREHESVCLEVRDDGLGFRPTPRETNKTFGLLSMHERMNLVDGSLDVRSAPGEGTTVAASVAAVARAA